MIQPLALFSKSFAWSERKDDVDESSSVSKKLKRASSDILKTCNVLWGTCSNTETHSLLGKAVAIFVSLMYQVSFIYQMFSQFRRCCNLSLSEFYNIQLGNKDL